MWTSVESRGGLSTLKKKTDTSLIVYIQAYILQRKVLTYRLRPTRKGPVARHKTMCVTMRCCRLFCWTQCTVALFRQDLFGHPKKWLITIVYLISIYCWCFDEYNVIYIVKIWWTYDEDMMKWWIYLRDQKLIKYVLDVSLLDPYLHS